MSHWLVFLQLFQLVLLWAGNQKEVIIQSKQIFSSLCSSYHFKLFRIKWLYLQWLNGEQIMKHSGGHLPFESDISDGIDFGSKNRITVAVNNTLSPTTLPPGSIEYMNRTDR